MNDIYRVLQAGNNEYTLEQFTRIVKHYDELYSIVQVAAVKYEKIRTTSANTSKEDILCTLVDVDQSIAILSPLQQKILTMLKAGHSYYEISLALQLSTARLKYAVQQALVGLTNYLNASQTAKIRKARGQ